MIGEEIYYITNEQRRFINLRKSAQYCMSVSRLMGSSSGKGTCRLSRVLRATDGSRSRPPNNPNERIWSVAGGGGGEGDGFGDKS